MRGAGCRLCSGGDAPAYFCAFFWGKRASNPWGAGRQQGAASNTVAWVSTTVRAGGLRGYGGGPASRDRGREKRTGRGTHGLRRVSPVYEGEETVCSGVSGLGLVCTYVRIWRRAEPPRCLVQSLGLLVGRENHRSELYKYLFRVFPGRGKHRCFYRNEAGRGQSFHPLHTLAGGSKAVWWRAQVVHIVY